MSEGVDMETNIADEIPPVDTSLTGSADVNALFGDATSGEKNVK